MNVLRGKLKSLRQPFSRCSQGSSHQGYPINIVHIFVEDVEMIITHVSYRPRDVSIQPNKDVITIAQSCVSSGNHLTTQFPSHGLGEPVAYCFQTLAKGAAL